MLLEELSNGGRYKFGAAPIAPSVGLHELVDAVYEFSGEGERDVAFGSHGTER